MNLLIELVAASCLKALILLTTYLHTFSHLANKLGCNSCLGCNYLQASEADNLPCNMPA